MFDFRVLPVHCQGVHFGAEAGKLWQDGIQLFFMIVRISSKLLLQIATYEEPPLLSPPLIYVLAAFLPQPPSLSEIILSPPSAR